MDRAGSTAQRTTDHVGHACCSTAAHRRRASASRRIAAATAAAAASARPASRQRGRQGGAGRRRRARQARTAGARSDAGRLRGDRRRRRRRRSGRSRRCSTGTGLRAAEHRAARRPRRRRVGHAGDAVNAGPTVTALVFDRLSPRRAAWRSRRRRAISAARPRRPSYVGIFGIDLALTPYAPFTRNARVLRQALDKMAQPRLAPASTAPNSSSRRPTRISRRPQRGRGGRRDRRRPPAAAARSALRPATRCSRRWSRTMIRGLRRDGARPAGLLHHQRAVRDHRARCARCPGARASSSFPKGSRIPPAVQRLFLGVIDAANRANVSIYTMDAAGLRARERAGEDSRPGEPGWRGGGTGILGAAAPAATHRCRRRSRTTRTCCGRIRTTGSASWRRRPAACCSTTPTTCARDSSGSRAICATTTCSATRRPTTPTTATSATIDVKVKRPGVTVAARKGYFARPRHRRRHRSTRGRRRRSARSSGSRCRTPFRCAPRALLFPERDRPGLVPVVVDLKTAPLTFQPAADGKTYSSDFAVIVRFLDQQNQVVRKVSQHYEVNGPIGEHRAREAGRSDLLPRAGAAARRLHDGNGRLRRAVGQVERAILDGRGAGRADAGALRMSSLVLVKRGEKSAGEGSPRRQPAAGQGRRHLSESRRAREQGRQGVGFYFTVYPAAGGPAPAATMRAAAQRQAGGADADDAAARRRRGPHPAGRPPADRSARRPAPTSCAPSSSRATPACPVRSCSVADYRLKIASTVHDESPRRGAIVAPDRGAVRLPAAQGRPCPRRRSRQSFTSTATAILVDVVVRDRNGRPVTDLTAADFEVAEDGVPQKVDTFTPRVARRRHRRRRRLEIAAADGRRDAHRGAARPITAGERRWTMRRRRSCSIICRRKRCGSRSGRRSTTCR